MDERISGIGGRAFDPQGYLQEYYCDIGPENFAVLRFAVNALCRLPAGGKLLDFGGGPSIWALIAAAAKVSEIHFCDYAHANLVEVQKWLNEEDDAFDWQEYVRTTLQLESGRPCTLQEIGDREALIRERVTSVFACDANKTPPIERDEKYEIVMAHFCLEAAATTKAQWRQCVRNVASLIKPNGVLLLSSLEGTTYYTLGSSSLPTVCLQANDILLALGEEGFAAEEIVLERVPADRPSRSYPGYIQLMAVKGCS